MYQIKIVADSSADMLELGALPFTSVPLKIIASQKEYVDDAALDVEQMVTDLLSTKEKSSTACPCVGDWLEAFGEAERIFCITITSTLSGSFNSANSAKQAYEEAHPDRKVCLIDSLSTGPEMKLIVEKIRAEYEKGRSFEEICRTVETYQKHTGLMFMLESLRNLANNGRVSRLAASAAGILGIRVIGKASERGDLEQLAKCRGEKKALPAFLRFMKEEGYCGGLVRISHCLNEAAAQAFSQLLKAEFPKAQVEIYPSRGLCSFYAEKGGMLVGFEKA